MSLGRKNNRRRDSEYERRKRQRERSFDDGADWETKQIDQEELQRRLRAERASRDSRTRDDRYYDDGYRRDSRTRDDRYYDDGYGRDSRARDDRYYDDYDRRRSGSSRRNRKRKGRHKGLKIFLSLLLVFVLIVVGTLIYLLGKVNHVTPVADTTADVATRNAGVEMMSDNRVINILLIGSDAREGEERQRSDSIILCSINTKDRNITLTSLMRDMYVPIPGYGSDRINAAYSYGDMELLDETVQQNFGVDVNGNALVDFEGFLEAMTAVGDLDIELTQEEADYLNAGGWEDQGESGQNDGWTLTAGVNSMTAPQVLAYARTRYVGNSDWDRTERQRKVLTAAIQKFKHSNPVKQVQVLSKALPYITTDMKNTALIRTAFHALTVGTSNIESHLLPVEGTYYGDNINGMSVLVPDLEANAAYLKQYAYGSIAE